MEIASAALLKSLLSADTLLKQNQKRITLTKEIREKDEALLKELKDSVALDFKATFANITSCKAFNDKVQAFAKDSNTISFRNKLLTDFKASALAPGESIASFDTRLLNFQYEHDFFKMPISNQARFLQLISGLDHAPGFELLVQQFEILQPNFDVHAAMTKIRNQEIRINARKAKMKP
jgi:hypothetical protein